MDPKKVSCTNEETESDLENKGKRMVQVHSSLVMISAEAGVLKLYYIRDGILRERSSEEMLNGVKAAGR